MFTDGRTSWGAQLAGLHRLDARTLLVDPYGTGESAPAARRFTMEECADAAFQILDAADVDRAVVLGLSWGGFVALRMALSDPERVTGLVLSNTSALRMPLAARERDRLMAALVRVGVPGGPGRLVAAGMLGETTQRRGPELAGEIAAGVDRLDRIGLSRAMRSVLADRTDVSARLHEVSVPTLVLDGAEDRQFGRHHAQELARRIPGARLKILPHAGHLGPRESPDEVMTHIEQFLTELIPYQLDHQRSPEPAEKDPTS
ncbi:alpha/beta fold hydrolase [Nocardia sp. NPDC057663]|uniref:alpha/beta fold hydrolase n=1 Tax=Nocardia sp. NPDC057663 TaxID=3346201 RepID=UPI0036727F4F